MKTPEGVEVRNNSIRISFTYKEDAVQRNTKRLDGDQGQH